MLVTRVIQCRMKDEVKMKQQKRVKEVKCFRYWGVGHCKQECPNIELERGRSKKGRNDRDAVHKVQKKEYNRRKSTRMRKK